ncbi:uncharacterized protein LOC21402729 [Morus notabilis]|uniref:uncharacterized protein LOC21402729 n=1 Tax=Morus notabilis TaxID=981085 RepID=UPI000CED67AB|nr:uncharacterized protein LOC21402729 [Morus notabilis]
MLKLTWTVPCSSFSNQGISGKRRGVPASHVATKSHKGLSTANQLGFLLSLRNRSNSKICRDKFVCNCVEPGASGGGPWNSWQGWILGVVVTLILPLCSGKWGNFLTIKNKIDRVVETAEAVAEAVEHVAEKVEEIADDIGNKLPNGKLKDALDVIETIAKETAKDAHNVDEFIEKVEEAEDKMESLLEPVLEHQAEIKETKSLDQPNDTTTT